MQFSLTVCFFWLLVFFFIFLLTFRFGVAQDFGHISIDGVLSQGTHDLSTLAVDDLPISNLVKQQERFLKLYKIKTRWIIDTDYYQAEKS